MTATFPDKHYFLNNEANRKLFLAQFKSEKTQGSGASMDATMLEAYSNLYAYKHSAGGFLFASTRPPGMSEYTFQPSFPEEHWFLNTAENRKLFMQQFPNEKWCDREAVTEEGLAKFDGKYIGKWPGDGLVYGHGLDTSFSEYTEYTFTPPAVPCEARTTAPLLPQFPTGFYFLNTPENLAAFEREFPGQKWNHTGEESAVSIMRGIEGAHAFRHHDFGVCQGFTSSSKGAHGGAARYYFPHEKRDTRLDSGAPSRNLELGEYITVAQGRLDDACREFSNVAEYCKRNDYPAEVSPKKPLGFGDVSGCLKWDQTDPWVFRERYACKEVKWAGSAKEEKDAVDAMAEASSFVASPEKPKLTNCCFKNTRANAEEFMRRYPDVKSATYRTAREMYSCDPMYEYLSVDDRGVLCLAIGQHRPLLDLTPPGPFEEAGGKPVQVRAPHIWPSLPLHITEEQVQIAKDVWKIAGGYMPTAVPPKPSRAKRILAYCLSPAKAWAQNIAFLCAVGGIGYGGWKTYEWAKENAPTIKWESKQEAGK